ncbi:peptidylprolyl isomerase [Candidatus Pelagibacter sp. HIMB1485]|uniref:peptidylprolyl isomerase n=1 Tax=Candidatus Pelagibacter sp. HIMB1485 TaxID=3415415 RepID=UPI003F858EEE
MLFKIYLNKILIYLFIILIINTKSLSLENKIVLKIDNEIITSIDVNNERNYLIALSPNIKEMDKSKLELIAKNSIIREKIKEKELLNYLDEINLNEDYLNQLVKERYSRLNLNSKDQFISYIKNFDVNIKTIEKKISIEALWNQMIYQKFLKNVKIDKNKLRKKIEENKINIEKNLLLSEILFKISKKDDLEKKYSEIIRNINEEGFEIAALTFSISDSSDFGGKLGWINQGSLNKIIRNQLSNMKVGDITNPILTPNGYLILKVDDIKKIEKKIDINSELEKLIISSRNSQLNEQSIIYFNKVKKNTKIDEL